LNGQVNSLAAKIVDKAIYSSFKRWRRGMD